MKRALCIWLPNWPLQRLAAARAELSEQAVVLYTLHASGGAKVAAYCPRLSTAAAAGWEHDSRHTGGIRPGMPLAEATALAVREDRATVPAADSSARFHLEMIDPVADRLAIEELAQWCHRFSPTVGLEEGAAPESLLLDVTGLEHLFGGQRALARRVVRAFRKRGLAVRVAIADTPTAAWAVAHFADLEISSASHADSDAGAAAGSSGRADSSGRHAHAGVSMPEKLGATADLSSRAILSALGVPLIIPAGEARAALAPLPPAALRLPAETCALLADLGVRQLGQLAAIRRETLLARFGPLLLERLDQATGAAAEAIVARGQPPEWLFEQLFEYPTSRREMIDGALEQLLGRACEALARDRRGMLRLECCFAFERRPPERFVVGFYRPSASVRHVGEVVRLKWERLSFREPLTAIRLRVLAIDQLEFCQREFFSGQPQRHAPRELAALVDRLSNRLGAHAVLRPWLLASAQPEFACQYRAVCGLPGRGVAGVSRAAASKRARHRQDAGGRGSGDRPLHLEPEPRPLAVLSVAPEGPPVRFRLAGRDRRIARAWGPERIETTWWQGHCVRRDYYQVETTAGERYWLFRELNTGRWFLHGMFT